MRCLLLAPAVLATAAALSLGARDFKANALEYVSEAAADREAVSFWAAQWGALEADLERFRDVAANIASTAASVLQLGSPSPVAKPQGAPGNATKVAAATPAKGKGAPPAAAAASVGRQGAASKIADRAHLRAQEAMTSAEAVKLSASLGGAHLSRSSEASAMMLAPMLAMLKDQYSGARTGISELNKREAKQKKDFEASEKKHKEKLLRINNTKSLLSAGFRANETRDENRQFRYWEHSRELQHRQYHNMLKLQHGMMQKEKTMIDMYEKTLSGKGGSEVKKELHQVGGEMPEVVLLQAAREAAMFYLDSVSQVRLNLLQLGHKDCPYCAAQCLDKCHSGGGSYGTCLTQCADAGKGF